VWTVLEGRLAALRESQARWIERSPAGVQEALCKQVQPQQACRPRRLVAPLKIEPIGVRQALEQGLLEASGALTRTGCV
jgi:hypothetical protein